LLIAGFHFFIYSEVANIDYSSTPICLLTLYIPHATMRKITYDWVRCLLT